MVTEKCLRMFSSIMCSYEQQQKRKNYAVCRKIISSVRCNWCMETIWGESNILKTTSNY